MQHSGVMRRGNVDLCFIRDVIASEAIQDDPSVEADLDCFVALLPCANASRLSQAMTVRLFERKSIIPGSTLTRRPQRQALRACAGNDI